MVTLDFIKKQPVILIGEWAIKLMEYGSTGKPPTDIYEKVSLIIDSTIDDFNESLEVFLSTITPYKCTYREEKLHITNDERLRKYTFYISGICSISGQKMEKPFMDVYNSGKYELIPYRLSSEFNITNTPNYPDSVKIGNLYVLMRFLLLDIWILRVIKNLGFLTPSILESKINKILNLINDIRNANKFNKFTTKVFQIDNYMGVYQSMMLYQKNKISDAKFGSYAPFYHKQTNGSYRDV